MSTARPARERREDDLLPPPTGRLSRGRQLAGAALLVVGLPLLTQALVLHRSRQADATPVLLVLVLVVAVALTGGLRVALPGAVVGALVLNWFFTPPYGTLTVQAPRQLLVLVVYLAVAVSVSLVVDLAARRTAQAARARAEALALSALAGATLAESQTLPDLLERVRSTFGMREVLLLERSAAEGDADDDAGWSVAARTGGGADEGELDPAEVELRVPAGAGAVLCARGPAVFAEDRRVLGAFARAAGTALEGRRLAERAREAAAAQAADATRTALLAAVGHDLRTPLAAVKASVSSLRADDVDFPPAERAELLEVIEASTDRLQGLVANLLDASRLQAGAVSAHPVPTALDEVVARVALSLADHERARTRWDVADDLPDVLADPGLLERVVANLVDNALRHAPAATQVLVTARTGTGRVELDVVDHGPGVPADHRGQLFTPFQRLGDRTPGGVGLGLSVARGFALAMGAVLVPVDTAGGGLTMRTTLPLAGATGAGGEG